MDDPNPEVRIDAINALAFLRGHTDTVAEKLDDEDPNVRCTAMKSLKEDAARKYIEKITKFLNDPEKHVRYHAINTLSFIKAPECIKDIAALIDDPEPFIRREACRVLIEDFKIKEFLPIVANKVIKDNSPEVRSAAEDITRKMIMESGKDDILWWLKFDGSQAGKRVIARMELELRYFLGDDFIGLLAQDPKAHFLLGNVLRETRKQNGLSMDSDISDHLDVSEAVISYLQKTGIYTFRDLLALTEKDLRSLKHLRPSTASCILKDVSMKGFGFSDSTVLDELLRLKS